MRARPALLLLFPLVLWAVSTLALGGDLGRWKDDYWLDFRDPVTNQAAFHVPGQFWRPLYFIFTPRLHSALAEHFWLVHVISAAVHGLVCGLLWWFLRSAGLGWRAAAAGAMLFMVYPGHWEIPLWATAMPTGLATGLFLCMGLIWLRAVQAEPQHQARRLLIATPAMALLAFTIACLNEQPTAGIPALPLLALAVRRRGDPVPQVIARSVLPVGACVLAVVLYLALYFATGRAGARGTAGTFVTSVDGLREKWEAFAYQFRFSFLFEGLGKGALALGVRAMSARPVAAGLWLGALVLAAAPWMLRWAGGPGRAEDAADQRVEPRLWAGAFGLAVFGLGWTPVLAIASQPIESRLCYVPILGLAIAFAAGADAALARVGRYSRIGAAATLAAALAAGAVAHVGLQVGLRERWRADNDQAEQLRALVPDPAPGTLFLPLKLADDNTRTGWESFDQFFPGALERPWSSTKYIRRAYRRKNIRALSLDRRYNESPFIGAEERGLRRDERRLSLPDMPALSLPTDDSGATLLPWGRIIPFCIQPDGRVVLVDRIADVDAGGWRRVFGAGQARAAADRAGGGATATFTHRPDGATTLEVKEGPPEPWTQPGASPRP